MVLSCERGSLPDRWPQPPSDLVLAVAMEFERYGLGSDARHEPAFDLDTLWRIPTDLNIAPFPPPIRKLRKEDIAVLYNRRAGNRGQAGPKT